VSDTAGRPDEEDHLRHLSEAELAAFLDGGLTPPRRRRVRAHIDICDVCRAELVDVGRATQRKRDPTKRVASSMSRHWWTPAVAAAGIVVVVSIARIASNSRPGLDATRASRGPDAEGQRGIDLIAPADDVTVSVAQMVFSWHAVPADVYKFSLLTERGDSIWTTETTDTIASVPANVNVRPGSWYFWRVDAIANGIVATTRLHRVNVAR
jgi:hypothetical protein